MGGWLSLLSLTGRVRQHIVPLNGTAATLGGGRTATSSKVDARQVDGPTVLGKIMAVFESFSIDDAVPIRTRTASAATVSRNRLSPFSFREIADAVTR